MAGLEEEMILTPTTIQMFMRCKRLYKLSQIDGWYPKHRPEYINLGTLFHIAMETWAKHSKESAIKCIKTETSKVFQETFDLGDFDSKHLEKAESTLLGMLEGYPFPVATDAPEREFYHPYGDHVLAGKIDGIRSTGGRLMITDYKTKGSLDQVDDEDLLKRNFQASFYFYLLSKIDEKPYEGVEFIYVRRPALRLKTKPPEQWASFCRRIQRDYNDPKRKDFYFKRVFTFRDRKDMGFWRNLHLIVREIGYSMEQNVWPMNETSCSQYRKCPYIAICNGDPDWEARFVNRGSDHHPELKGE